MDTKEKILLTALDMFARDGYEAVSIGDISGALGLSKGALYKHFKNKRDIFDSLVLCMEQFDYENAKRFELPVELFEDMPEGKTLNGLEKLSAYIFSQFVFWTENDFASRFRRLLSIERHRNSEMEAMYQQFLGTGVMNYIVELLQASPVNERFGDELETLALELYSPVYMLIDIYDGIENKAKAASLVKRHIEDFVNEYA